MNRRERRVAEQRSRSAKTHHAASAPIIYLARAEHLYTIRRYLEGAGKALCGTVLPVSYEQLFQSAEAPDAVYIFSDIERLPPQMAAQAARIWARLSARLPPGTLLNHPIRSMRRYELLRTLRDSGDNRFDVFRLKDAPRPMRFPVFVRPENEHLGPGQRPVIFQNAGELDEALRRLAEKGARQDELLITEWLETADAAGIHRKYGVFCIAGRVIPRHVRFSRNWVVKYADLAQPELLAEEREFVATNPHAATVARIFATARIDYGRIDYWIDADGRLQTWEINTNPAFGGVETPPEWAAVTEAFCQAFNAALLDRASRLLA
jgi:hypothetical protein